ncbi:uncharacterized protein LOC141649867 [Silene latifolia]|uniref:uncharacterized protein LOC141649867 n=1 Tax=Silene latifolia TaxID=37657 RepID=UPI003D77E201
MEVVELLKPDGGGWWTKKINQFFLPFEVERITNIRLSPNEGDDLWYWVHEKDGFYSVRTAYKMLAGDTVDMADMSNWKREKWLWNKLWKVLVWPRVKLFFWQLCNEDGIGLPCEEEEVRGSGVREWVEYRWRKIGEADYGKFMIDPAKVVRRVHDVLAEESGWMDLGGKKNRSGGRGRVDDRAEGWMAPSRGVVKVNVDAGVQDGFGVGTGAICRAEYGAALWGMAINRAHTWDSAIAEPVAILDGVQEAARRGHRDVVVESDCLQVIEDLQRMRHGRSILSAVLDDILALSNLFNSLRWSHTSRTNNCVAHALAHFNSSFVGKTVWDGDLPPIVNNAVLFDISLLN